MSSIRIHRAGLCSTIQDQGRIGFRHLGVPCSGAMDQLSHQLANRLVGNPGDSATIEMTLTGDELEFSDDALIAITGADMQPILNCNDTLQPVVRQCPVVIAAGSRIRFQAARRGCRCYVAIAGGVDVPVVMGSRSTMLRAKFGGHCGRTLMTGDELKVGTSTESGLNIHARLSEAFTRATLPIQPRWFVRPVDLPDPDVAILRIVTGTHTPLLDTADLGNLFNAEFRISSQSDRMGYRLINQNLTLQTREEMLSEGVVPGTLQLPPDGNPILLMADCAPTGGYPRIGHVISADLGIAAQLRPGQCVKFAMVTLTEAQELFQKQQLIFRRAMQMVELQSCHVPRAHESVQTPRAKP